MAALTAGAAHAAQFWIVLETGAHIAVVDTEDISATAGGNRRAREYMVSTEFVEVGGRRAVYMITDWEFDCAGRRNRELSLIVLDEELKEMDASSEPQAWEPIQPGSNAETELRFVCGERNLSGVERAPSDDWPRLAPMLLQRIRGGGPGNRT